MVESPDFIDPAARHPGVQPLRQGAPADAADDGAASTCCSSTCRTSAAASTRSLPRCATCSRRRPQHGKSVWVLDRPNPAGRPVEGLRLRAGLGELRRRGPAADAPRAHARRAGALVRRHAEARRGLRGRRDARLDAGRRARATAGRSASASWVNPSPNAPNLSMARCYPGTVMLEGTTLSEGRGTTRPLELFGAPDLDAKRSWKRCVRWHRSGCAAAGCARAGSSRRSTSTPASSARACRSTSRTPATTTPRSGRGG